MTQNTRRGGFSVHHFVRNHTHNSIITRRTGQLKVVIRTFWLELYAVGAVCEIRSVSYESKHGTQSLSIRYFVHAYTRNFKTTGRMRTF